MRSNHKPRTPSSTKHAKKGNQLQLQQQHANSQDQGTEGLQETALLARKRFDYDPINIGIESAAPAHTTAKRAATAITHTQHHNTRNKRRNQLQLQQQHANLQHEVSEGL